MEDFSFFDEMFEAVLVEDFFGNIVYFNSAFLSLFQISPSYFKRNPAAEYFFQEYFPSFLKEICRLMDKNQKIVSEELDVSVKGLDLSVILKGHSFQDLIFYFFKDISVEKELHQKYKCQVEELKSTHGQLLLADKLKLIGEMSASISHEINNPLTIAIGNSEMISFTLESAIEKKELNDLCVFNENINNSLQRIKNIIISMRDFLGNNDELEREYCTLGQLIIKSLELVAPYLKDLRIDCMFEDRPDNDSIVFVSSIKIEQVIINLLKNSIDALRDSSTVHPQIKIWTESVVSSGFCFIYVEDNGPGIERGNQDKIFDAFFSTKDIGKGTGLGLSISNRIMEVHHGHLKYIPNERGAIFRMEMPKISFAHEDESGLSSLYLNVDIKKVLFISKSTECLNYFLRSLKKDGHYFIGVDCLEDALKVLYSFECDFIFCTEIKIYNELISQQKKDNVFVLKVPITIEEINIILNKKGCI